MAKQEWKPGNMLYPLPAVLITCADKDGKENVFTVAWAGTICTNPPMVSISVRPERFSHGMIMQTKEFVINLTTEDMAYAVDFCGVRSGRDVDKFEICKLTREKASKVNAPLLVESPVCLECKVKEVKKLGSHDMFIAEVVAVHAEEEYMDQNKRFRLKQARPLAYSHGEYYGLGKQLGTFGYSVKKSTGGKRKRRR